MDKVALAVKSLFSTSGRNLIKQAVLNRSVIPLFRLQAGLSRSYIPGPAYVCVELTNRCNLNCVMCARRYWDPALNPLGDMSYDFFARKVLVHLRPHQIVNLQCMGESLLNEVFLPALKACKARGCMTTFTTNGILLEKFAADIVSSGADDVCISMDGIAAMKKIRGIGVDRIISGIDSVNEAKRRLRSRTPLVSANCVVTRENLAEVPELVELLGSHGVSRLTLIHLVAHHTSLVGESVIPMYPQAEKYFEAAQSIARKYRMHLILPPQPGSTLKCYQPLRSVFINWDGEVRPCCMATFNETGSLSAGNLNESTLPEIWNNAYMHRLRKSLSEEKNLPEMCVNCAMRSCSIQSHTHLLPFGSSAAAETVESAA